MSTVMPEQTDTEAALARASELLQDHKGQLYNLHTKIRTSQKEAKALEASMWELQGEVLTLQAMAELDRIIESRHDIESRLFSHTDNPPDDRHDVAGYTSTTDELNAALDLIKHTEVTARRDLANAILNAAPKFDEGDTSFDPPPGLLDVLTKTDSDTHI